MLASAAGVASTVMAADNTNIKNAFGKFLGRPGQELTEEQKTEMKTKMDAVKAALEADDYTAWATAVKAVNENSPVLSKINADNFSDYVNAWKLRQQADTIMEKLGLGKGEDMGGGHGHGMSGGFGPGGPGEPRDQEVNDNN